MDDSQQPPPEETAGPAPDAEPEDPPVNSLTVDALWVKNLPQTWCHADSGEPPDYRDNLFQWELDVALREEAAGDDGGATLLQAHCFKGGRLRQVSAQLPPQPVPGGFGSEKTQILTKHCCFLKNSFDDSLSETLKSQILKRTSTL
ncbi:hypothetical protein DIPPA_00943 [Diplonema papillatum]|nr:hypothetical protein DIPPA_33427 [Diplonema papillatum]KAJ9446501.1 hypothetical protein DIPPA_00943 [Diplonema papillatum]